MAVTALIKELEQVTDSVTYWCSTSDFAACEVSGAKPPPYYASY